MPIKIRQIAFVFAFLTCICPSSFADEAEEAAENLYQVEVIAFISQNHPPLKKALSYPALPNIDSASPLMPYNGQLTPFENLPQQYFRLSKAANRIASQGQYQLLFHYAWVQAEGESKRVHLFNMLPKSVDELSYVDSYQKDVPYTIDGTFHISKGLYYYLRSHFIVRTLTNSNQPYIVFKDARRLKQDEIHYLDHPQLGLLVEVHPLKTT